MRIASALTVALSVATLGGLAIATIIDVGYHRLRDLDERVGRKSVVAAKLRGIYDSAVYALAVTGVGLQNDKPDLTSGALRRLSSHALAIRELGSFDLVHDADERVERIEQLIGDLMAEVESGQLANGSSVVRLATFDGMAAELGALIAGLQQDAVIRAEAAESALFEQAQARQRTDLVLLSSYSILMVLILFSLLRYIAAPVRSLMVQAEDAMELGHGFRAVSRGPRELKQLGGTIASLVGNLESKVGERTSELAEQAVALRSKVDSRQHAEIELRKAMQAAAAASQARSQFLSVMSHELRTPMNAILGTLSLLRDTELENGQRTYVETAEHSGRALMALLNDVIDMSRIASGGVELAECEFDLIATLDQVLSLFHPACCEKRVVLAGMYGPDVVRLVRGDQPRIRQILTNLVGNAVKFTDDGHVHVRIDRSRDDDHELIFSVKDTGKGIPEEDQRRVFTDFTQADPSDERPHGGAGLGLAICKGLVGEMGGTITLTSQPGAGSEFRFTVPLLPSESVESPREVEMRRQLRDMNVVIAGSCFALAESLRRTFEGWVASVEVATDPVTLSRLVCDGGPGKTCIICGPPDRPVWPALLAASQACCDPENMIAIVPCAPGAVRLAASYGAFRAIHDRALKPLTLLRLLCGHDISDPDGRLPETARGREANILLVDDSAANRLVASAMLEKAGYSVAIAENGREAMDMVKRHWPDLILMDLQMPVMSGYDALAGIRAMPGRAGATPVIALSANIIARSDADRGQIGFDAYLAKPLSRKELLDTVAATLELRAAALGADRPWRPDEHA